HLRRSRKGGGSFLVLGCALRAAPAARSRRSRVVVRGRAGRAAVPARVPRLGRPPDANGAWLSLRRAQHRGKAFGAGAVHRLFARFPRRARRALGLPLRGTALAQPDLHEKAHAWNWRSLRQRATVPGRSCLRSGALCARPTQAFLLVGHRLREPPLSLRNVSRPAPRSVSLRHDWWRQAVLLMMAVACRAEPVSETAHLLVEFPDEVPAGALEITPRASAAGATLQGGRLLHLKVEPGSGRVTLRAPGACPLNVDTASLEAGKTLRLQAKPWIDVGPPRPALGLGQHFRIAVEPGCSEAREGRVSWRQLEGKPPRDLRVSQRGFLLEGTTQSFEELFPKEPESNLLPVSPATQGRMLFEATCDKGELEQRAQLQLSALSRSRGLPNVPTGATVLLGGNGWQLESAPEGAQAKLVSGNGFSSLRPLASGRWVLESPHGDQLSLLSAAYQDVPLDCARAGCHAAHDARSLGGMSDVLSRGL